MFVNKKLFIIICAALLAALLVAAFLLGKISNTPTATSPSMPPMVMYAPDTPNGIYTPARIDSYTPSPQPAPSSPDPAQVLLPPQEPNSQATPSEIFTRKLEAAEAPEIRDYFNNVEIIMTSVKSWSDPQAFAESCIQGLLHNDDSAINGMIVGLNVARDRIAAVNAPVDCRNYHNQLLALVADNVKVLEGIKEALKSGKTENFAALSEWAQQLKQKAAALDQEAQLIKTRNGIN